MTSARPLKIAACVAIAALGVVALFISTNTGQPDLVSIGPPGVAGSIAIEKAGPYTFYFCGEPHMQLATNGELELAIVDAQNRRPVPVDAVRPETAFRAKDGRYCQEFAVAHLNADTYQVRAHAVAEQGDVWLTASPNEPAPNSRLLLGPLGLLLAGAGVGGLIVLAHAARRRTW